MNKFKVSVVSALMSYSFLISASPSDGKTTASTLSKAPERIHDTRTFIPAEPDATTFSALSQLSQLSSGTLNTTDTHRFAGVLNGAAYRIEIPNNWNGSLVMYTHGFRGATEVLTVENPLIRRHLLEQGYAWAASSYSKNYYDVQAGIEDTNALALNFVDIAKSNGLSLAEPENYYIIGFSMGGHIAAASVEKEVKASSINKVDYAGSVPLCGVVAPYEQFNTIGAMYVSARALSGFPDVEKHKWQEVKVPVMGKLFSDFPSEKFPQAPIKLTELGEQYASVVKHLTGGERPLFNVGLLNGGSFTAAFGAFTDDRHLDGVINKNGLDTSSFSYLIDDNKQATAKLNKMVDVITPSANFNPKRDDGLRWIPLIHGEFDVPVVSLHTLGDLFVPFSLQQHYAKKATANGNDKWLVQRAIRGITHCDFTVAEVASAFDDMVTWVKKGVKPLGDDVLTKDVVADKHYGCQFTNNNAGEDDLPHIKKMRRQLDKSASCEMTMN